MGGMQRGCAGEVLSGGAERMSPELFKLCYDYKVKYKDNRLLVSIIKKTNDSQCLSFFSELDVGKKLKTLAKNKLKKLK